MLIVFELDIPSLTQQEIQMNDSEVFNGVKELQTLSMIDSLVLTEMLILLIVSFDRRATYYQRMRVNRCQILQMSRMRVVNKCHILQVFILMLDLVVV